MCQKSIFWRNAQEGGGRGLGTRSARRQLAPRRDLPFRPVADFFGLSNVWVHSLPRSGFLWLFLEGLLYSVGAVFYALGDKIRHFHGICGLFSALAGSIEPFAVVLRDIA